MLKQLIQRLLDSRTTPAQAANASKPVSGIPVEYNPSPSIGIWGQVLPDSIAVSDGYIWAAGRTSAIGGFLQVNSQAMQITTSGTSIGEGEMLNIFIPVSKGQGFTVYARSMNQIVVRLVRTIGGGYNILLRRALSCLRPSFNYLPKVFLRAKRSGYLSGRSNWLTPRQSLKYQRQTHGRPSQCRLTVGQLLKAQTILQRRLTATSLKGNTKCSVFASVVSPIALQQFLFRAKKAKPSALPFTQTVRTFPLEHLKHFRLANLETGGALC